MGTYLNPGSGKYQEALDSDIYVDKSCMIKCLNSVVKTEQKYVSVSRPRRFGKSIAANMLCAYYGEGDSRNIFQHLKLAEYNHYTTIQKLDSGKGYVDLVYLPSPGNPDKPVLLVELKYNKSVKTAADQIRDRNYPQKLEHYKGNILLVSVNYDKDATSGSVKYKHHSCAIEVLSMDLCKEEEAL